MKNELDYPTYSSQIEASLALLALNNSNHLNHKLSACYCTNKYCNSFLKGVECTKELNDAYDRMNGIEGYSASARASAIFSGLGFKDGRLEHH